MSKQPKREHLAYLASPYSHPDPKVVEQRFVDVCKATSSLLNSGHFVLSPIAHSHPVAVHGGLPGDFAWWGAFDTRIIEACDSVWVLMLAGWDTSTGVAKEVEIAKELGKPVLYIDPEVCGVEQ